MFAYVDNALTTVKRLWQTVCQASIVLREIQRCQLTLTRAVDTLFAQFDTSRREFAAFSYARDR